MPKGPPPKDLGPKTPAPKAAANSGATKPTPPHVPNAKAQRRHYGILFSFVFMVLAPLAGTVYYLYVVAHDQYASYVGFTVRSENISSAQNLLGSLSSFSGGASSSDTDILYEFIKSQTMVERVMKRIDLAAVYSFPDNDPYFAYDPSKQFEDLVDYWQRMVKISYASGGGLIELRVMAFRPEDARDIAQIIIEESSDLINELSDIARSDATSYAEEDLNLALSRLKNARRKMTLFRSETRIIDPLSDLQGQMGLLNSLEAQLAEVFIDLTLLQQTSRQGDPRIEERKRRISVIENLIEKERRKFSINSTAPKSDGKDYSTLVGEYENLSVEVEYAQQAYLATQTILDTARAEAQRQSRYLATYAKPSLAQSSRYPERGLNSVVIAIFLLVIWSVAVLIYYSLRDRR